MKYYAVKNGKVPGIYNTWDECKENIHGFKGAIYKKFDSEEDAINFMEGSDLNEKYMNNSKEIGEDEAILYVDGSFRQSDNTFSYGYVLITKDGEFEGSQRYDIPSLISFRNVAGEIFGAVYGIKKAMELNIKTVYLHHDYSGIRHWALKEWKAKNELTQKYQSFFDAIKSDINVEFIKVKAHNNIEMNEKVDKLAKDAKI